MLPNARRWLLPLLAFLYLFPFPYFPAIRSPNEGCRLYETRAIVDDGVFFVDRQLERYGPMGDLSQSNGHYYSTKAPGISLAGALVYAALKASVLWNRERVSNGVLLYFLRALLCALPTLLLAWALRRRLWAWTGDGLASDAAVLTYGLGSLAYTYGLLFFSHQLCAVLLCGSFLLLEQAREEDRLAPAALAGLCAGSAVLVEYTAALAALPLGLYALFALRRKLPSVLAFGLASLPPQLGLLLYHKVCYGGLFDNGYKHNVNPLYQSWHERGFMGMGLPTLHGLLGSFFDPARGLFVFSPFLILGPIGLYLLRKQPERRAPLVLLSALFCLYSLFTASMVYESWGWTVGPRHLTPLAALLVLPVGVALAEARKRGAREAGVALGLCLASIVATALATVVYPHFPEVFTNGLFELTLPLLSAGFLAPNALSYLLGFGAWSWALYFAGLLALLGWLLFRFCADGQSRGLALATLCGFFLVLGLSGRGESPQKVAMLRFVEQSYHAP
ncbi:MAG: hypothetical protein ACYCWW_03850 [Deltaproteobacteria bacterium]